MKIAKKITAALLAAATAATMLLPMSSGAAKAKQMKLIKATSYEIGDSSFTYMGQDLYKFTNYYDDSKSVIYKIDSAAIAKWRKTGKLSPSKVTMDKAISQIGYSINEEFNNNNIGSVYCYNYDENDNTIAAVKYNPSKNKITAYGKNRLSYSDGVFSNGNIITYENKYDSGTHTIKIMSTNDKLVKKLTYKNTYSYSYVYSFVAPQNGSEYAYIMFSTDDILPYTSYHTFGDTIVLARISSKGEVETISEDLSRDNLYSNTVLSNGLLLGNGSVYSVEKNSIYKLDKTAALERDGRTFSLYKYGNYNSNNTLFGSYMIAKYGSGNSYYRLIDYTKDEPVGDIYRFMRTDDNGKTYAVVTVDGKMGFANSEGKLLGTFDAAGTFIGDYAPVINGGYVYLIDKKMNCVSEKIKYEGKIRKLYPTYYDSAFSNSPVSTLSKELFCYDYNQTVFTFKK